MDYEYLYNKYKSKYLETCINLHGGANMDDIKNILKKTYSRGYITCINLYDLVKTELDITNDNFELYLGGSKLLRDEYRLLGLYTDWNNLRLVDITNTNTITPNTIRLNTITPYTNTITISPPPKKNMKLNIPPKPKHEIKFKLV